MTLEVRGREVEMLTFGDGRPLLYLHSFMAEGAGMPSLEKLGSAGFTVYRPSLPGFGATRGLEEIDGIDDLVFWLLDVLEASSLSTPLPVVGTCIGGWLAAELAVRYPDMVEKLVLTDAPGIELEDESPGDLFGVTPPELADLLFADQELPIARLLRAMDPAQSRQVGNPESVLAFLRSLAAAARLAWNPYFSDPKLSSRLYRIKSPTLVIWGSEDAFIPEAVGRAYATGIGQAEFVTIEACGHLPPIERPDEWFAAVERSLG